MKFYEFFHGRRLNHLLRLIALALEEDGRDLTSLALFREQDRTDAHIVAKQDGIVAGLPIAPLVFSSM